MGAVPSKESVSLFSFFRGSYEVGLIPLTKHYFGSDEEEDKSPKGNNALRLHQAEVPSKKKCCHSPGSEKCSTQSADVIDRKQLRSQLLQIRRDPAILYSNARDTDNMIRSIKTYLQERRGSISRANDSDSQKTTCSGTTLLEAEGSPIVGPALSPTKIGSDRDAIPNPTPEISAEKSLTSDGNSSASVPLIRPSDSENYLFAPGINRIMFQENFWDVMPEPNFTEDDLDNFLELVENELYETDEDMLTDPRYSIETEVHDASKSAEIASQHNINISSDDVAASTGKRQPQAFIPIPCALCLAYPPGKERLGCFPLEGRSVNLIGYFGCMTKEMQKAFKVTKRNTALNDGEDGDSTNVNEFPQSSAHTQSSHAKACLYFNTSVLTSAGDRTLERVLVLAPVMLRQQFHVAHRRALINQKIRDRKQFCLHNGGASTATKRVPDSLCAATKGPIPALSGPATFTATTTTITTATVANGSFGLSEGSIGGAASRLSAPPVIDRSASGEDCLDPLFGVSFPLLPPGTFMPRLSPPEQHNEAPEQGQPTRTAEGEVQRIDRESGSESPANLPEKLESPLEWPQQSANHFFRRPSIANTIFNEVTDPCTGIQLSNADEDAISWGFIRRLNTISITIEASSNNYPALKSLTENFAFMHSQLNIDPSEMEMTLDQLPVLDNHKSDRACEERAGASNPCTTHDGKETPLPKSSAAADAEEAFAETTIKDEDAKSKPVSDINIGTCNAGLLNTVSDSCCTQVKALGVANGSVCDTDGSAATLHAGTVPSLPIIAPYSGVTITLQPSFFRQGVLWLSCLFCHPLRLSRGRWIQYKLKDEFAEVRRILQRKDMLVSLWRQNEKEKARGYLGPHTERLLEHVHKLQEETESARALLLSHSGSIRVFTNQDKRRYTLHRGEIGTLLIAARGFNANHVNSGKSASDTNTTVVPMAEVMCSRQRGDHALQQPSDSLQKQVEANKGTNKNEPFVHRQRCTAQVSNGSLSPGSFPATTAHGDSLHSYCSPRYYHQHFSTIVPQSMSNKPSLMSQSPQTPQQPFTVQNSNNGRTQLPNAWVEPLSYYYGTPQVLLPLPSDINTGCGKPVDVVVPSPLRYELPQEQQLFFVDEPIHIPKNTSGAQSNHREARKFGKKMDPSHTLPISAKFNPLNEGPHADQIGTPMGYRVSTAERVNSALEGAAVVSGGEAILNTHQLWNYKNHGVVNYPVTENTSVSINSSSMSIWPQNFGTQNMNDQPYSNNPSEVGAASNLQSATNLYLASNNVFTTSALASNRLRSSDKGLNEGVFGVAMQGCHHAKGVESGTMEMSLTSLRCSQVFITPPTQPQQLIVPSPIGELGKQACNADNLHSAAACMGDIDNSLTFRPPTVDFSHASSKSGKMPVYTSMGQISFLTDTSAASHGNTSFSSGGSPSLEVLAGLSSNRIDPCGSTPWPFILYPSSYQTNQVSVLPPSLPLSIREPHTALYPPSLRPKVYCAMVSGAPSTVQQAPGMATPTTISVQPTLGLSATMSQSLKPL